MLRTSFSSGPDAVQKLRSEWQELVANSATATPFQTFDWQSTWLQFYRRSRRPLLLEIREGTDLIGLYPLLRSSGAWRSLRPIGVGASDYLHPISITGREREVEAAVAERVVALTDVDLVDLHQIRETRALVEEIAMERPVRQATCLVLDLPPTYDAYLATLGKSLRYDVRRLDKTLFKEGKAVVRPVSSETIGQGLDILFEQHKLRWRKRGLPGAFLGRSQQFHHAWARLAIERGWLWLSILEFEQQPIGAIYAMRLHDCCYYYQAGFDPSRGSISPGTLLVASTIKRAIEEGATKFDFLRGDEPYKRRWKPQHEFNNMRLMLHLNKGRGNMGRKWNEFGSRVEKRVRDRLEGKGLLG